MDDLEDLVELHAEPGVERFMGQFDRPRLAEWIALVTADWAEHGYGRLAMIDRATSRLVGRTGLKHWPEFARLRSAGCCTRMRGDRASPPKVRAPACAGASKS